MKYLVNIDLAQNELLNAVVQNLAVAPSTPKEGQIYCNTTSDKLFAFLNGVWVDLTSAGYVHPTQATITPTLSGANVLASFEVNALGHVVAATTRVLTLANLGYTGAVNANNYVHPTFTGNGMTLLSGAQVISNIVTNTEGHVTSITSRTLTAADLNFMFNDGATNSSTTWTSTRIQQAINNAVSSSATFQGSYNANTNVPSLEGTTSNISAGFTWVVSVVGDFYGQQLQVGDDMIANVANPSQLSHWTIISRPAAQSATTTIEGILRLATAAQVIAGTDAVTAVTPATLLASRNTQRFKAVIGDGTSVSYVLNHNIGTKSVNVQVFEVATGRTVITNVDRTTINSITILVNNPLPSNSLEVIISEY